MSHMNIDNSVGSIEGITRSWIPKYILNFGIKMTAPNISISLATEEDAPALASVMTAAFAGSDAAYPLIWGSAGEGTHDMVSVKGLFTPVQKEGRVTFKAVDEANGKLVGFATWNMPKEKKEEPKTAETAGGLPPIPGVNLELWGEKVGGPRKFFDRDVDAEKDIRMFFSLYSLLKPR